MKQSLSIVFLSLSSLIALADESGSSCAWQLAKHGKISSQVTGTLKNRLHVRAASGFRWWRNDKMPAEVERAQKNLAQLEENLLHDDRLDMAVHQTRRHIEAVEFAYVIIKSHLHPMRDIFKSMIAELAPKKTETLEDAETAKLEDAFRDVGRHYADTNSYGRFSEERHAVRTLRLLEEIFTSRNGKAINRAKVINLLKTIDDLILSKEKEYAQEIGKHITTYEMLKSYLDSPYEDRHLAYSLRTENLDVTTETTNMGPQLLTSDATPPTADALSKEQIISARKKTWEKNRAHLKSRIGWESTIRARFPDLSEVPAPKLDAIRQYYDESIAARLTHNRRASVQEFRITALVQIIDLTLVGTVIRPLVAHVFSGPGKLRRSLNALREWSQKAQKSIILKNIQELVESKESTIEKAANLASYASDPRVGPYFLQLFASYSDLNSRIAWREIHDYTKQEDSYYKDLAKMMEKAQEEADKNGVPVAIQTSYWSPSQTTALVIWVIGIGYYNLYGDEDEELDNKVQGHFWDEMGDLFGIGPEPEEAPQNEAAATPETAPIPQAQ